MPTSRPKWLLTGAGGQFGSVLMRELVRSGESVVGLISPRGPSPDHGEFVRCDLGELDALAEVLRGRRPAYVAHAGAVTRIQAAHGDPALARRVNVEATARLCEVCGEIGARLALTSTDLVFDGTAAPYVESSPPAPLSEYGRSKVAAEEAALRHGRHCVVRLSLMYGLPAARRDTTFSGQLSALRAGHPLALFEDEFRTPILLEDAARSLRRVLESKFQGVVHVGGPQRLSRLEMGRIAAAALGVNDACIVPSRQRELDSPEPRPADVSLDCGKFEQIFGAPPGRPMAEAMIEMARAFPFSVRDSGSQVNG